MTATVHSTYPPLPPSYPRRVPTSSISGSFSHAPTTSFDGPESAASTPAPTPPPPAPRPVSQQQMSYSMNGASMSNGVMGRNSFGSYPDPNPYSPAPYYTNDGQGQIYTAVYSNVSVYEMEVNGVAVMRRRSDGWLNATQILKVAGVDKGKRTKVLEKEILHGEHEKVQGGYGKYQGTWINYRRGVEFCHQYGVEGILRPLLEYDISPDGMNGIPPGMETPTKEQAMAAQRKRMYGGADGRPPHPSAGGTFFKNMSSTAVNAVHALTRTRVDSPARGMDGRRSVGPRRPSQQPLGADSTVVGGSQPSLHSMASQDSFSGALQNGGGLSQGVSVADFPPTDMPEPPRKRLRPSPPTSFTQYDHMMDMSMPEGSPTEPSHSFLTQYNSFMAAEKALFGLEPLPAPQGPLEEQKREQLLDLFIDPTRTDFDDHPAFLSLSGEEFELPIDGSCNTALHWAATLARIPLVTKLLEKGFNVRRTNSGGETALIAACQARNNLDHGTFSQLLDLLGSSIEIRDGRGRTLLHHIAVSSAMKGRAAVGRYYLESLLEFVVRQGSTVHSQDMSLGSVDGVHHAAQPMTLARFMSEIVNARDAAGDTALNLAARTSTTSIIDQLLEVGADPHVGNRGGLAPVDFGVGATADGPLPEQHRSLLDAPSATAGSSQASFAEAQSGMLTSIREILNASEVDFLAELREKQDTLDKTNAALKESGSALAEERRRLDELQAKARERDELEQKIQHLQRAAHDLRTQLQQGPNAHLVGSDVPVGEADKGLDFHGRLGQIELLFPHGATDPPLAFTPEQSALLDSLERAEVLRGRARAYQRHNHTLEAHARALQSRSAELEERYKKIVSLCTGAEVEKVDSLLDELVQAVVSEQKEDVELGRIRDFLRLVHGSDG